MMTVPTPPNTDTPTAREAARSAAQAGYERELRCQGWWSISIGEQVLTGFAADAVLDALGIPADLPAGSVASALTLRQTVLDEPRRERSALPGSTSDWMAAEHNATFARLRAVVEENPQ